MTKHDIHEILAPYALLALTIFWYEKRMRTSDRLMESVTRLEMASDGMLQAAQIIANSFEYHVEVGEQETVPGETQTVEGEGDTPDEETGMSRN